MSEVYISVRGIVEFILRSGNIDTGYMSQNRMQEGVTTHRRVQRARKREAAEHGLEYEAEVRLKLAFDYGGLRWNVSGVADGIVADGDHVTIEEIKSTYRDMEALTPDEGHWHMAQAKCYGYMYAEPRGIEDITVNLTYSAVDRDDSRTFSRNFTLGELKAFFYDLVERYRRWAELEREKLERRNESARAASFPYDRYRKGQREFAVLAYKAVQNGTKLFIEAPTGTGKTISALFPAIKALGEGLADKVFYLTARTITRQAAEQAAGLMMDKGCALTYVAMTARDKLCFLPERTCTPAACACADGHFDRVNDALWVLLERTDRVTREIIEKTAREFMVCPYELMLDASLFADLIICDYNYVFDPTVALKRFFGDAVTEKYIFLIDEAHNLPDRAREMYSATIRASDFAEPRKTIRGRGNKLARVIADITAEIKHAAAALPSGAENATGAAMPRQLHILMNEFTEQMDKWLAQNAASEGFASCMETYFRVLDFIRVYDEFNERYTVYVERSKTDAEITLLCLDPSENLATVLSKAAGSIFFSATLTPISFFRDILGGRSEDKTARLPSPFDRANLCVAVENRVSTKYKDRSLGSYSLAADALYAMISAKRGNYFAFFSSYAYLENVLSVFTSDYPDETVLVQSREMSESEREVFLAEFSTDNKKGLLAFAVMGGVFSEGIDLTGDRLIGAAVVGVGLPLISPRRDAQKSYYDQTLGNGFEYAYMYPGMNKVLQAAGRVIRTESDRGIVLLIDTRFTDTRYQDMFPYEWQLFEKPSRDKGINDIFINFWNK